MRKTFFGRDLDPTQFRHTDWSDCPMLSDGENGGGGNKARKIEKSISSLENVSI